MYNAAVQGCGVGVSAAAGVQQLLWLATATTTVGGDDGAPSLQQRLTLDKVTLSIMLLTMYSVDHVYR